MRGLIAGVGAVRRSIADDLIVYTLAATALELVTTCRLRHRCVSQTD